MPLWSWRTPDPYTVSQVTSLAGYPSIPLPSSTPLPFNAIAAVTHYPTAVPTCTHQHRGCRRRTAPEGRCLQPEQTHTGQVSHHPARNRHAHCKGTRLLRSAMPCHSCQSCWRALPTHVGHLLVGNGGRDLLNLQQRGWAQPSATGQVCATALLLSPTTHSRCPMLPRTRRRCRMHTYPQPP